MNYYLLDFSGTHETAPKAQELEKLRKAGVELSHEYSMSISHNPREALDLYYNARTLLTLRELENLLRETFAYAPGCEVTNFRRVTIRGTTVEQELDARSRGL